MTQPTTPRRRSRLTRGHRLALAAVGSAFALILLSVVIGVVSDNGSTADPGAQTTGLSPEQRARVRAEAGLPPSPDPETRTAYLAALDRIDPDIVHGEPDRAVSRGLNQCGSIRQGHDRSKLVVLANGRFTSPDHPQGHGSAAAERILDVVHEHLCPDF